MKKMKIKFFKKLGVLSFLGFFASCGSGYVGYSDGIYGEEIVYSPREEVVSSNDGTTQETKMYYQQKIQELNQFSQELNQGQVNPYGSSIENQLRTEQNQSPSVVNIYNVDYNPYEDWYYRSPYFLSGSYIGFHSSFYNPYRVGWSSYWGYGNPYYGGYWGGYYAPYYSGYWDYYAPYPRYYYGNYYSNYYYNNRNVVRTNTRRGDSNRYNNYSNRSRTLPSSGYNNRNYSSSSSNSTPQRNSLPSRGYENRNYNRSSGTTLPSSGYENRSYSPSTTSPSNGGGYRSSRRR